MTDAQRKVLEDYLDVKPLAPGIEVKRSSTHATGKVTWAQLDDAIAAALADLDGLAPLRDRAEENQAWIAYGAERERQECAIVAESKATNSTRAPVCGEIAALIRARGPLAPPAPWEVRVAELERALRQCLDRLEWACDHLPRIHFAHALEAARQVLGD